MQDNNENKRKEIELKIGIFPDMTNEDYQASPAWSRSQLKLFNQSKYKFKMQYLNPNARPQVSTKAMEFGTAFHSFILEPLKFASDYIKKPEAFKKPERVLLREVGRPAYEGYKAKIAEIDFKNDMMEQGFEALIMEGKKVISPDELILLHDMKYALDTHESEETRARDLIYDGLNEQSLFWLDQDSMLYIKARPDIWHDNMIVDLKTCYSADSRTYQRVMTEEWYNVQGAIIREGIRVLTGKDIPHVINVCIEKTYPHEIGIKIIDERALDSGYKIFKQTLLDIKHAIQYNDFPSYTTETVELPGWAE